MNGMTKTRLGVAMMDDAVGLVMVQVISNFDIKSNSNLMPITVVRPILGSLAFAVVVSFVCRFIVKPITLLSFKCWRQGHILGSQHSDLCFKQMAFTFES